MPNCELCGEPMLAGEEMFKYHGYSGNCPKPPLAKPKPAPTGDRWIADLGKLELSERQADGSYRIAYKMQPIAEFEADVKAGREVLERAKEQARR